MPLAPGPLDTYSASPHRGSQRADQGNNVLPAGRATNSLMLLIQQRLGIHKAAGRAEEKTTRNPALCAVEAALQTSPHCRFFDGKIEGQIGNIQPGETFTIVIEDERLVLGRNIMGNEGIIGGKLSHVNLMSTLGANPHDYRGRGGAARFNADGSVDVSGYHRKTADDDAAKLIASFFTLIAPEVVIRTTAGKLSALPFFADGNARQGSSAD